MNKFRLQFAIEKYNGENINDVAGEIFDFTKKCDRCEGWLFVPSKYNLVSATDHIKRFFIHLAMIYYKRCKVGIDTSTYLYYRNVDNRNHCLFDTYRYILLKAKINGKLTFEEFQLRMNYHLQEYDNMYGAEVILNCYYIKNNTCKVYTSKRIQSDIYFISTTSTGNHLKAFDVQ